MDSTLLLIVYCVIGGLSGCLLILVGWVCNSLISKLDDLTKSIQHLSSEMTERINHVSTHFQSRINEHERRLTRYEQGIEKINKEGRK